MWPAPTSTPQPLYGCEAKIIIMAEGDPNLQEIQDLEHLSEHLLRELENFFDVYKMLEPGTSPAPDGHEGCPAALQEIQAARNRAAGPRP